MNEKEEKMGEIEWVEQIKDILNAEFKKSNPALHAETQVKLPYGIMISGFDEKWNADYNEKNENRFATDLLIYEEKGGKRIPRVVVEAKFKKFTTHDAITYGKKAVMHKNLMPALRYGLMLGAMEDKELTWRLFEHGGDFDFMFSFKAEEPDDKEREKFFTLVNSETDISKKLEEMFGSKGAKSGIYYLHKNLELDKKD